MLCYLCNGVCYLDVVRHVWVHTGEQDHVPQFRMAHVAPPKTVTEHEFDGGYSDWWRLKVAAFKRRYSWKRPRTIFGLP